jgi:hypothetical protein
MRPKGRVAMLAAFLGIVGTGLVFISSAVGTIANNRLVKVLLE